MNAAARPADREDRQSVLCIGGLAFVADPAGALFLPEERLLLVADLHLEKGSSFARRHSLLPPYDSRATLAALGSLVARYEPVAVAVLGDAFHDVGAEGRMALADAEALHALQRGRDWIWLAGNHDPRPSRLFGGQFVAEMDLRGVTLRHQPSGRGGPEIAGHLHPVGKVSLRGRAVRRRCFAHDGRLCVMPAFGAYTGGLNVLEQAFAAVFPSGLHAAHLLGRERVYRVGRGMLRPD